MDCVGLDGVIIRILAQSARGVDLNLALSAMFPLFITDHDTDSVTRILYKLHTVL